MKTLEKLFKTMPQAIIIGQAHSLGYARQVERLRTIEDCKQFIKDYKERSEAHSIKFICEDEKTLKQTTETIFIHTL